MNQSFLVFFLQLGLILGLAELKSQTLPESLARLELLKQQETDTIPVTYNHFLQAGYLNMPSARVGEEGELGFGYSNVPPYQNYNLRFQFSKRLEISGNYRIFCDVDDPILSPFGFGDFSDKGVNVKYAFILPEDSGCCLPGLAFGLDDFIGTKAFNGAYLVATQLFLPLNLEISIGYGPRRWNSLFGGVIWMPFRNCLDKPWLRPLAFVGEWDSIDYEDPDQEPHPDGRIKKSPINYGVKWRLFNHFDFSFSRIRGTDWAASISASYNFGKTDGFLPHIDDPLPYRAPMNFEPLGARRSCEELVGDLLFPFYEQGFEILDLWLDGPLIHIKIDNFKWLKEYEVKYRLYFLLANLTPANVENVIVEIEGDGFSCQEYHFPMLFVRQWREREFALCSLDVITPRRNTGYCMREPLLFHRSLPKFQMTIFPRTYSFFGSSTGKFKYSLGVNSSFEGYLWDDLYYYILLGYNFYSTFHNINDFDILNPSQIINVRTDAMRYLKQMGFLVDQAYLQKNWNLSSGCFYRIAGGLFEDMYGGAATEFLYYPASSNWAIGMEAAILRKRTDKGIGFTDRIRKFNGHIPVFENHFIGSQAFINLYGYFPGFCTSFRVKAGRFLARDLGVRLELGRDFQSGMQVWCWYTMTNGHDKVNNHTYFDQGVGISLPLEIFHTYSSRNRWSWSMSAWLRDVGAIAANGFSLYDVINDQRR